ncbi:MAG: hypothetical protein JNM86_09210 [Phycisphaerae bacterium]|nr:hypothetical protein [Phycisphaerae bacterium]
MRWDWLNADQPSLGGGSGTSSDRESGGEARGVSIACAMTGTIIVSPTRRGKAGGTDTARIC